MILLKKIIDLLFITYQGHSFPHQFPQAVRQRQPSTIKTIIIIIIVDYRRWLYTEGVSKLLTGTVCLAGMKVKCLEYSVPLKYIPSEQISDKGNSQLFISSFIQWQYRCSLYKYSVCVVTSCECVVADS